MWLDLRQRTGVFQERLREAMRTLSHRSRCPAYDLNHGTPEYETGMLTVGPPHSINPLRQSFIMHVPLKRVIINLLIGSVKYHIEKLRPLSGPWYMCVLRQMLTG
jgi:hypothetical protein